MNEMTIQNIRRPELRVPAELRSDHRTDVRTELRGGELTDLRTGERTPTLGQVAELAGVSIATASRVLNNSAPVSVQARQQVRDAVVRLGYVRHRAAPSSPRGRVRSVAAVV